MADNGSARIALFTLVRMALNWLPLNLRACRSVSARSRMSVHQSDGLLNAGLGGKNRFPVTGNLGVSGGQFGAKSYRRATGNDGRLDSTLNLGGIAPERCDSGIVFQDGALCGGSDFGQGADGFPLSGSINNEALIINYA
jgi:hypothetical protein